MTVRCSTYAVEAQARRAARAMTAAGVPADEITLLAGRRHHDLRDEPVGGFAGPVAPEAPVGKYAGPARRRRQAAGGFAGEPDRQRQGTYADADLGVVAACERGAEHARVTSDLELRRILWDAHLARDTAERVLNDLHAGRAVILAPGPDAHADLDAPAHAA